MKIFGYPRSICTRKVLMTLAETNTPYELVFVDLDKGEHKQAAYLAVHPFGLVPALQDGDFEMYEARAMCRYINEKTHGSLIPNALHARARMEQWISVESATFAEPVLKFVLHYIYHFEQSPEALKKAADHLTDVLPILDRQLARFPYFAGESFTLADVCFVPHFEYALAIPLKELFSKHTHVMAWWSKVSARPTWEKVVGIGNA